MTIRPLVAAERLRAIADGGEAAMLSPAGASPHLAQYGISARDDDGVFTARARVHGHAVLVCAQDETFVGGTAGARHAAALAMMFERARTERPAAVVLLLASGGVRLHEANPAELALARALRSLLDARAAGVPVLALGIGDVFGGVAILAAAADRLALLARTRFGVSAAKVIEAAAGKTQIDADNDEAVRALYGAEARSATGLCDLVADDADVVRTWIATSIRAALPFSEAIAAMHARLAVRLTDIRRTEAFATLPPSVPAFAEAKRVDAAGALWKLRAADVYLSRPCGNTSFGPASAWALDDALLARLDWGSPQAGATLVVVEDSTGHEATRRAEAVGLAQFLAHHAAVLARLRARGHHVVGLLAGSGGGAAFYVNALQASLVYALDGARVVAMPPTAIARVTGQDAASLATRIEDDPLVGHPVHHFASWGGIARILQRADAQAMLEIAQAL
jgi:malonate decarboxylase beta subunit